MTQPLLVKDDPRYVSLDFDGSSYEPAKDKVRLNGQQQRVYEVMRDGRWRTLAEIAEASNVPLSTVGSRVRDFRKPRFGHFDVQRKRLTDATHVYRLVAR